MILMVIVKLKLCCQMFEINASFHQIQEFIIYWMVFNLMQVLGVTRHYPTGRGLALASFFFYYFLFFSYKHLFFKIVLSTFSHLKTYLNPVHSKITNFQILPHSQSFHMFILPQRSQSQKQISHSHNFQILLLC